MSAELRPGKVCLRCGERVQIHLFPKLAPGRYGDVCRACVKQAKAPKLRVVRVMPRPKGRVCGMCEERKGATAFRRVAPGEYAEVCRVCERKAEDAPAVPSGRRLCLVCGPQIPSRFAKDERGRYAECCAACCGVPEVRVLVRHEVAAAVALKTLRMIAAGRLDCQAGVPTLGADGLSALALEALKKIDEARSGPNQ